VVTTVGIVQTTPITIAGDASLLSETIADLTALLISSGSGNINTTTSLHITLTSATCPSLTLVDLPGLIKVPLKGDSSSIVADIASLTSHYMANPAAIILAVVPATVDLATAEVLKRAATVDESHDRTVGVLTKADLLSDDADEMLDLVKVITNVSRPMRLGYVMTTAGARTSHGVSEYIDEKELFENKLSKLFMNDGVDVNDHGTTGLINVLSKALENRMLNVVTQVRSNVVQTLKKITYDLESIPLLIDEKEWEKKYVVVTMRYVQGLVYSTRGGILNDATGFVKRGVGKREFEGMGICDVKDKVLADFKNEVVRMIPDFDDPKVVESIGRVVNQNRLSGEIPGFISRHGMTVWISQLVEQWREVAMKCVEDVAAGVEDVAMSIGNGVGEEFGVRAGAVEKGGGAENPWSGVVEHLHSVTCSVMYQNRLSVITSIEDIIDSEKDLFTLDSDALIADVNKLRWDNFKAIVANIVEEAADESDVSAKLVEWYGDTYTNNSSSTQAQTIDVLRVYVTKVLVKRFVDNVGVTVRRKFWSERVCLRVQDKCLEGGQGKESNKENGKENNNGGDGGGRSNLMKMFSDARGVSEKKNAASRKALGVRFTEYSKAKELIDEYLRENKNGVAA
jgi:hypothetical protein